MDILLSKRKKMNTYEKFADLNPCKVLEENLVISKDGSEVLFKVGKEENQEINKMFISLDLVNS